MLASRKRVVKITLRQDQVNPFSQRKLIPAPESEGSFSAKESAWFFSCFINPFLRPTDAHPRKIESYMELLGMRLIKLSCKLVPASLCRPSKWNQQLLQLYLQREPDSIWTSGGLLCSPFSSPTRAHFDAEKSQIYGNFPLCCLCVADWWHSSKKSGRNIALVGARTAAVELLSLFFFSWCKRGNRQRKSFWKWGVRWPLTEKQLGNR